jgi:crotonobetainyl-CoA:carnitine CoA-transferase CaiB-like acyl-CoA transferase
MTTFMHAQTSAINIPDLPDLTRMRRQTRARLRAAMAERGVPVAKAMQPHRQTELAQLTCRGFFEDVEHPVNGRDKHSTVPMRVSGGPARFHVHPAPLLGQHNRELLTELGLTASEIADLEADGVIGRTPAMYDSSTAR